MKNPFARTVKPEHAYFRIESNGWSWSVLKLYQSPEASLTNPYARAFCLVVTDFTGPSGDLGDTYVKDIPGLKDTLTRWIESHKDTL
jgi:hypothetical protein